jgi:tetratricopeptide (TPR) repeat protein
MYHFIRKTIIAGAALLIAANSFAAEENKGNANEGSANVLSTQGSTALKSISAAIDAKNFADAQSQAAVLISVSAPGSMDYAYANLLMANIFTTQNRFANALPFLETALAQKLFAADETERYTHALAQLYVETKQLKKAVELIKAYAAINPKLPDDMTYMYALVLKETGDIKEANKQAEKLMRSSLNPPKEYYQLAASCAQDLGNYDRACAYLERLIQMNPKNEMYWEQLVAMHYSAGEYLPAIVVVDRAQEAGFLLKPTYYELRIELYYNMERFREAAQEIERCLDEGKIGNEQRFWEIWSNCYDMLGEPQKSIEVLKKGSKASNWSALDVRLGEFYYKNGDYANAAASFESAIKKGHSEKLGDIWLLIASADIENKDMDKAAVALANAGKYPEVAVNLEKLKKTFELQKENLEAEKAEEASKRVNK